MPCHIPAILSLGSKARELYIPGQHEPRSESLFQNHKDSLQGYYWEQFCLSVCSITVGLFFVFAFVFLFRKCLCSPGCLQTRGHLLLSSPWVVCSRASFHTQLNACFFISCSEPWVTISHLQEHGGLNWFANKQSEAREVISWMLQLQEEKPCSFFFSEDRKKKKKKEVAEIGTLIEIWVKNFRRRTDPNGQSAYKRCSTSLVIRNANQKCQELRHTMLHLLWSKTALGSDLGLQWG